MHRSSYILVLTVFGVLTAAGCNQKASAASGTGQSQAAQTASAAPKQPAIVRLAFLDKEQACDCTKARIEKSWNALQAALGSSKALQVDRIHADTEASKAAPLMAQRKAIALPALYFLDTNGWVVELLQGEIEESAIRKALQ